jgi:excisionase family DNA binding protein
VRDAPLSLKENTLSNNHQNNPAGQAARDSSFSPHANPRCFTIPEACEMLSVCRTTLYGLVRNGEIKTVKIGKRGVRVPVSEIHRFVEGAGE